MTLIIGCITKEFGVLAGDTQVTLKDSDPKNIEKYVKHKTHIPSVDFMYGIFGNWSKYVNRKETERVFEEGGSREVVVCDMLRYDHDDMIISKLADYKKLDKLNFAKDYLKRWKVNGAMIYIQAKEGEYEIDYVSNEEEKAVKRIELNGWQFLFNECYSQLDEDYVENTIREIINENNLSPIIEDSIFLLNNVLLRLISKGNKIERDMGKQYYTSLNTVGGYVTMQIMRTKAANNPINLAIPYRGDKNCFLDCLTNPFSNLVYQNISIIYLDNLTMLLRTLRYHDSLDLVIGIFLRQLKYIEKKNIIPLEQLSIIKNIVSQRYDIRDKESELVEENKELDIANGFEILIDDFFPTNNVLDSAYISRFL